jgi:hypothetical protein
MLTSCRGALVFRDIKEGKRSRRSRPEKVEPIFRDIPSDLCMSNGEMAILIKETERKS